MHVKSVDNLEQKRVVNDKCIDKQSKRLWKARTDGHLQENLDKY